MTWRRRQKLPCGGMGPVFSVPAPGYSFLLPPAQGSWQGSWPGAAAWPRWRHAGRRRRTGLVGEAHGLTPDAGRAAKLAQGPVIERAAPHRHGGRGAHLFFAQHFFILADEAALQGLSGAPLAIKKGGGLNRFVRFATAQVQDFLVEHHARRSPHFAVRFALDARRIHLDRTSFVGSNQAPGAGSLGQARPQEETEEKEGRQGTIRFHREQNSRDKLGFSAPADNT